MDNISTFPWSENIDLTWTVSGATSCSTTSDNGTWNNVSVDATDGSYTDSARITSYNVCYTKLLRLFTGKFHLRSIF